MELNRNSTHRVSGWPVLNLGEVLFLLHYMINAEDRRPSPKYIVLELEFLVYRQTLENVKIRISCHR